MGIKDHSLFSILFRTIQTIGTFIYVFISVLFFFFYCFLRQFSLLSNDAWILSKHPSFLARKMKVKAVTGWQESQLSKSSMYNRSNDFHFFLK